MWKAELMVERAPEVTYALSVRIMASFARRRTPAAAWSVDDASTFAAQKEFKLLQLLSTDKKAFATARRLGLYSTQPQLQQTARSSAAATATSARRRPDAASGRPVGPNSRQKRSAERSARHHAQLQVQFYRTAIAVLYICRLRRMCRARRLQARLADLESLDGEPVSVDSGGPPSSRSCALRESSSKRAHNVGKVCAGTVFRKMVFEEAPAPPRPFLA